MMNESFKGYQKNPAVICTELDDGAVLLDLDTKYYFNLNETGLRIWQIMEGCQDPAEIAGKVANEYEVDLERAKASVIRLMVDLEREGIILSSK